ncbi:MAG: hypothetical protein R3346_03145 [Candidatus Spechtbacterales bacterium]|nr:hypothetical protein [Candidatus Spechtbacterales bacterium]
MRKEVFYHGSPIADLTTLEPQLDRRLGIRGVFLSHEPYGPMVFSLISDRSRVHVEYKTKRGQFFGGKIVAPFDLNDTGWLYKLEVDPDTITAIGHGEFYSSQSIKVCSCKKVTREDVLKMKWKVMRDSHDLPSFRVVPL